MKTVNLNTYYYKKSEIDDLLNNKANLTHMHGNITNDGFISNQASKNVVTDANGKITTEAKPTIPAANTTATNIKMNGTQSAGSLASFAKADHVHPVDTSRAAASHTHSNYLTSHQDISGKENISNKTTAISSSSTDTQYPSAKATYTELSKKANSSHTHSNYLTSHQDISGKEDISNKTTTISSSSTDTQYPSAKATYTELNKKANSSHTHDDRYYTETEINTKLNDYLTTSSATSSYQPKGNYVTTSAIKNDLTTGGASNVLSAEQGKTLKGLVDGKAPNNHASTTNTYGLGSTSNYGHVKTINSLTQNSHSDGTALSAYQGYLLNDKISKIVSGETATDHNHDGQYLKTGTGTVTSTNIADKTIVNGDIADGTIESGKIKDGTIVNGDIANTTITGGKLVNGTVTATQLASNAVETAKIKDGAITNAKLSGTKITASSSSIVDLNDATYQKTGFYYCEQDSYAQYIIHCPWSNGTATPYTGNKGFFLFVEDWGTNSYSCKQTLTYYNGNNTFTRTKTNTTTWSAWREHNANNNDYLRVTSRLISGESAQIPANRIIAGSAIDSKYHIVVSGLVIDPKYPILFNTSAINSGSFTDNTYIAHTGVPLTNNVANLTVTSQKQVYIEGTSYDGRQFIVSDKVFVSEDNLTLGNYYIYIGNSYSTTQIRFNPFHQTVYIKSRDGLVPVGDNTHNPHMLIKGDAGDAGYFKFMTIQTTGTYHDHTVEFDVTHRGNKPKTVVSFNFNTYSSNSKYYINIQAFYYHGYPTPIYYIQTNNAERDATFDFYIKRDTWDEMGVSDLRSSINNYNGMTVTWHNEFVTTLPTGTTQATLNPYYAQVGHTHGSVANNGTLNSDITSVNKVVVTDSNNSLKTISQIPYSKVSGTPTIPTKTSQLTNDSGFLTSHQSITGKADKTGGVAQVTDANANNYSNIGSLSSGATQQAINNAINTALGGKQAKGNYLTSHNPVDTALSSTSTNAVQNKVVNTALNGKVAVSQGTGNSGKFLKVNSSGNVACESVTIPTKTSQLTNDSNYIKTSTTSGYIKNDGTIGTPTNTTYGADRGISNVSGKFGHSNTAITAQTKSALKKIKYDAYGHITGTDNPSSTDIANLGVKITDTVYTHPTFHASSMITEATALGNIGTSANVTQATINGKINAKFADTGLVNFPYNSNAQDYSSDDGLKIRQIGNIVNLSGLPKTLKKISANGDLQIGTLEQGYCPLTNQYGATMFAVSHVGYVKVATDGKVYACVREGPNTTITSGAYFPVNMTWIVD